MPKSFRDLFVFKLALDLMDLIYEVTESFPRTEVYGLTSQLRRASIGVMSHIAEGQGRLTFGEWRLMLSQARGSLFEVEAQCIAAHRRKFLGDDDHGRIQRQIHRTGKALLGLIRYVRSKELTVKSRPRNPVTPQPLTATRSPAPADPIFDGDDCGDVAGSGLRGSGVAGFRGELRAHTSALR